MELPPLNHEHPLELRKVKSHRRHYNKTWCTRCGQSILGFAYKCQSCSFIAHNICARLKLPETITHSLDSKHHFLLSSGLEEFCNLCEQHFSGCIYRCDDCRLFLCLRCSMRTLVSVKHAGHQHPLFPVLRPVSGLCDACGSEHDNDKGFGYGCSESSCSFYILEHCASLPSMIADGRVHMHTLFIQYSSHDTKSVDFKRLHLCDVCKMRVEINHWNYHCSACDSYVHLTCLPKTKEGEIALTADFYNPYSPIHLPIPSDSLHMIAQFLNKMSGPNGTGEKELNHEHPLTLVNAQSDQNSELILTGRTRKNYKVCDACVRPILEYPFYICNLCNNFLLHKWCAELPNRLEYPSYLGPLSLKCGEHEFFICDVCNCLCNGFAYSNILENLDVKCASLPRHIRHEAHKHPLLLLYDRSNFGKCGACDQDFYPLTKHAFRCVTCRNFQLHYMCALLPHTVKHRYDEHPFTLYYSPIQEGPNELVCVLCEDVIKPTKSWFYHCDQCDQSICIQCVYTQGREFLNINLRGNSNIKFGVTYKCNNHPHPLSLFEVTYDMCRRPVCERCKKEFKYDTACFKCNDCSIALCVACVKLDVSVGIRHAKRFFSQ